MDFREQALKEYNSEEFMAHPGGVNGRGFWNTHSIQFTYCPSFAFPVLPKANGYLFTLTDETGKVHTFTADKPTVSLAPIWKDVPTGMAVLKVEALDEDGNPEYVSGMRTFFKADGFPGRENLPPKACSYKECAIKGFKYAFNEEFNQYWLKYGKPDPMYPHNVYPSKTISSVVIGMIKYAQIDPENREAALKLATNAADYLLSLTYGKDTAVEGLPPTYSFKDLDFDAVDATAPMAKNRTNQIMMFYPASAGSAYFQLYDVTGDKKYYDAAMAIAEYYKNHVLEDGSWYLMLTVDTGKPESNNRCASFAILSFLSDVYKRTGEEIWHTLEKNYFKNLKTKRFERYNWEGQFEDIVLSGEYENLTHIDADSYIDYITHSLADEENTVEDAKDLLRYVEDQFVVWGRFAPISKHYDPGKDYWYSPAGLEQYYWYVPIDGSTSKIMKQFLNVYSLTKEPLLLEKAYALGDAITRMQNKETGVIPTHWLKKDCAENLENFWINCHLGVCETMMKLAEIAGEI